MDILIGDFLERWTREIVELYDSHTKKDDYKAILKCWIIPIFRRKEFSKYHTTRVQKFIATLKAKIGKNKGKTLSRARIVNILTVLRAFFEDAVDEFNWDIPDPFRSINRYLPKSQPKQREIFMFGEWQQIITEIDPWYRPMVEFMMLTGMIHSEISGLMRSDIRTDHILIQQSIVRKVLSPNLKTRHRHRRLPITVHMRRILEHVLSRTDSQFIFAEPNGRPYLREGFIEDYWMPALQKAGVPYRPPYSIRHSFAGWSLLVGIDPLRLVKLMGHGSKQMVFEVYGNYIDGLERDFLGILNYLGRDYVETKRKPLPYQKYLLGESTGESQGLHSHNQLITLDI